MLLLASAIAWLIAGRVLAPVQLLTETAHSISQSDLTRRIEVRGRGEAADMARSFNAMLDRLEAVFRSQREFVQDASHELRDPLTICRGHLELLGDDPEERREAITIVLDELDRMGRIVDDLQLLAEADQPDFLQPDWTDLGMFTDELARRRARSLTRDWALDANGRGGFFGDRHRLTEAVMNLAHNAVQHTLERRHDRDRHLARSATRRASGCGTPAAASRVSEQERIFDRFTRGRGAHSRYRGGGLGLAIVKAIAEGHGGRVELESRLGEGSTFTIVIPRIRARTRAWRRILIAEDDPLIGSFVEKGLRASGYSTFVVDDGERAQALGLTDAFDLLILDMGLPGATGLQVIKRAASARRARCPCSCSPAGASATPSRASRPARTTT